MMSDKQFKMLVAFFASFFLAQVFIWACFGLYLWSKQ